MDAGRVGAGGRAGWGQAGRVGAGRVGAGLSLFSQLAHFSKHLAIFQKVDSTSIIIMCFWVQITSSVFDTGNVTVLTAGFFSDT